jgi:RimJ/RimL family protein N-acetyltransferase
MPLIRPGTAADVPAILPMVDALLDLHRTWDAARFATVPHVLEMYRRWLPERAGDPESVLLVAEAVDTSAGHAAPVVPPLLGFIVAQVQDNIPIYTTARFGWVHDLWVEPHARGQGVATALLRACVHRLHAIGCTQVRGETAIANEAARALLARLGWRASAIEMQIDLTAPASSTNRPNAST